MLTDESKTEHTFLSSTICTVATRSLQKKQSTVKSSKVAKSSKVVRILTDADLRKADNTKFQSAPILMKLSSSTEIPQLIENIQKNTMQNCDSICCF